MSEEEIISNEEKELAVKHGLTKEKEVKDEHEEQPESGAEVVPETKEEGKEEEVKEQKVEEPVLDINDLDSFEKIQDIYDSDKEKFYKLPKAVVSLFHNSRGLYKRLKETEADKKKQGELVTIKEKAAEERINKAVQALSKEGITVEEIQSILSGGHVESKANRPLTVEDYQKLREAEKEESVKASHTNNEIANRMLEIDGYGATRAGSKANYDAMVESAKQVMDSYDKEKLFNKLQSDNFDPVDAYNLLERIARTNPQYSQSGNTSRKVIAKQKSSASVGSGNGQKKISYSEMTDEELIQSTAAMSQREYDKLPDEVRERILSKI